jgi:feruloyl esterase
MGSGTAFAGPHATTCEQLLAVALPDTLLTIAQTVPAGTFQPPTGAAQQDLPEFCRVAGEIRNHPTSRITFEVWMPTQISNHRFVQVGNGGFAGTIQYGAMATRLREGYATASTDDGTSAPPGVPASQRLTLLGDFERLYDFKGRAVTLTAGVAKSLYTRFYAGNPRYSYFTGGSTGGLEALAVVQRIGRSFDGVSAGCPANNSAGLFTQAIWTSQNYQKISSKVALIHDAALAACDTVGDGVVDGVIGNPEACHFDPRVLQCKAEDGPGCLMPDQVEAARLIYKGPVNPATGTKTGEEYAPGMPHGSELVWNGSTGQASSASRPWYGMVLQGTLDFDLTTIDFRNDVARALELTKPYGAQVTNPDISEFRNHGGKLLLWAGWNDPLWSQGNLVRYYKQVVAEADQGPKGPKDRHNRSEPWNVPELERDTLVRTQKFARLFMAPGTGHCGGGDGPNSFDTFVPLVDWVERGRAPDQIIATKFVNNQASQGVDRTRPLCPYPANAVWNGKDDPNLATSFRCVSPRLGGGKHDGPHGDHDHGHGDHGHGDHDHGGKAPHRH